MKKLNALLLTEGKHGMISQVEGMAKALNAQYNHKIVSLSFPWKFVPPKFTPVSELILKDKDYLIENNKADLIISCGRKSVIPALIVKKKNPKIFTLHIQDPKISLKNFDIIIAPAHDNLNGENVYSSKGAIHYITQSAINNAKSYLINKVKKEKIVSLILGGPNKYYSFGKTELNQVFNEIRSNFISKGYEIIVVPSMRTPKEIIDLANKEFSNEGYVLNSVDKNGYLSALALAEYVVVTCDSTSMISEAASSGKPIFVAQMKPKRNNYRFKKFFNLFNEMGITKNLGENTSKWTYNKLNEAERIAKKINNIINN
jgi:uncharacterized protein